MAEQTATDKFAMPLQEVRDGVIYQAVDGRWKPVGTVADQKVAEAQALLAQLREDRAAQADLLAKLVEVDGDLARGAELRAQADDLERRAVAVSDEMSASREREQKFRARIQELRAKRDI